MSGLTNLVSRVAGKAVRRKTASGPHGPKPGGPAGTRGGSPEARAAQGIVRKVLRRI
jgi:hypothetical protein